VVLLGDERNITTDRYRLLAWGLSTKRSGHLHGSGPPCQSGVRTATRRASTAPKRNFDEVPEGRENAVREERIFCAKPRPTLRRQDNQDKLESFLNRATADATCAARGKVQRALKPP